MVKCSRSSGGGLLAEVPGAHPNVAGLLESDIQGDALSCQEYIDWVDKVESGQTPEWEGTGNAYTITIRPGLATIECVWDESLGVAELPTVVLRKYLEEWRECIRAATREQ